MAERAAARVGWRSWLALAAGWSVFVVANAQRIDVVPFFNELRGVYGVDYTGVGAMLSAYLLGYVAAQIPAGLAADNLPTRRVTLGGLAAMTVASGLFALSADYWTSMVLRVVMGLSGAMLYSSTVKLTLGATTNRASAMGVLQSGAGAGMIAGLSIMPLIAGFFDARTAFLAMAAFSLAALLYGSVFLGASAPRTGAAEPILRQLAHVAGSVPFRFLSMTAFMALFAVYGITAWMPTYLRNVFGLDSAAAGAVASLVNVAMIISAPLAGVLSDRLGSRTAAMLAGYGLLVFSFCLLIGVANPFAIGLSATIAGVGLSLTLPITTTLTTEVFGISRSGIAVSLNLAVGQIASTVSGVLFGALLDATGSFTVLWTVGAAVAVLGFLPVLGLRRLPIANLAPKPAARVAAAADRR